jgi:hypothetical protein
MLRSQLRLPGESRGSGSLVDRYGVDPVANAVASNPGTAAGAALGGIWAGSRLPTWGKALRAGAEMDQLTMKGTKVPGTAVKELVEANAIPQLKDRLLALHDVLKTKGLYGKGIKHPVNLLALPAAAGAGYMIDRYIKGQNR